MPERSAISPGKAVIWHGQADVTKAICGVRQILTTDLGTTGNTVVLEAIPANFQICDAAIDIPDMDNGTTLTLSLGTRQNPTLLLNASTAGQTGVTNVPLVAGARGTIVANQTDLILTITAAATTPVAGNIFVCLFGKINP